MTKTGAKPGRKSSYDNERMPKLAEKACRLGATDDELARFFDVAPRTIDNWIALHDEFREAVKAGREIADAKVADRLYSRAVGFTHPAVKIFNDKGRPLIVDYTEHYPPDTTACIFWLKNRRPDLWRDRHEITGKDGGAIKSETKLDLSGLSSEELHAALAIAEAAIARPAGEPGGDQEGTG